MNSIINIGNYIERYRYIRNKIKSLSINLIILLKNYITNQPPILIITI
jgi:hypothetical protein